jgi:AP-1 complex subunit mu
MLSALFILDVKGRVIIHRDYRGDISPKCSERFMAKLNELEGDSKLTPVIYDDAGISYVYLTVREPAGH